MEHPEDPHRPGSAVLDAVQLVRRKVEARSCLERDGTPADVRGSLARDDVSHLVVAVAMEGRLARLDDAHELGHVKAAGVLVHEVPEGPLARGVELGLVGEANRHLALAARRLPLLRGGNGENAAARLAGARNPTSVSGMFGRSDSR